MKIDININMEYNIYIIYKYIDIYNNGRSMILHKSPYKEFFFEKGNCLLHKVPEIQ